MMDRKARLVKAADRGRRLGEFLADPEIAGWFDAEERRAIEDIVEGTDWGSVVRLQERVAVLRALRKHCQIEATLGADAHKQLMKDKDQ